MKKMWGKIEVQEVLPFMLLFVRTRIKEAGAHKKLFQFYLFFENPEKRFSNPVRIFFSTSK